MLTITAKRDNIRLSKGKIDKERKKEMKTKKRKLRKWVKVALLIIATVPLISFDLSYRKNAIEQCSKINGYDYCITNLG